MRRPLPGLINSQGIQKSSHEGTAVLAPEPITVPFEFSDSTTGLYRKCFQTHRVNAVWVQVARKVWVLIFCVYLKTGASAQQGTFQFNDAFLDDLFAVCAQFGGVMYTVHYCWRFPYSPCLLQFGLHCDQLRRLVGPTHSLKLTTIMASLIARGRMF